MPEKEYIEREAIKKAFAEEIRTNYLDDYAKGFQAALLAIMSIPSADVAPARHGCFRRLACSGDTISCSECKMAYNIFETNGAENFNFCPHCGAKIDKTE